MRISIFGLGYVGCVTAACLAHEHHTVIGVDVNPLKTELLGSGRSPVAEPGLDELVKEVIASGKLTVDLASQAAVNRTDISLICVGTPSNSNGSLKTVDVEKVCREIGTALATKSEYHVVVVRSTVLPGTVEGKLIPILEQYSGRRAGSDFGVCMYPEFLREGTAIDDFYHPGQVVIGELDDRSGQMVQELYGSIEAPTTRTALRIAEMVKYASNAFHALKVVFANEMGNLCKAQGIDGQQMMEIFIQDQQLNISSNYLRPGFAFGGSCLPKDLRAIAYRAKEMDVESPLLNAILQSNQKHVEHAIRLVENTGHKKIGILGLTFKADTDDVRESPTIALAETLLGRGYQVRIFDEKLQLAKLFGANKRFLETELPHIASLLCPSIAQLLAESNVVVVTNSSKTFQDVSALMQAGQTLIDLVGIARRDINIDSAYEGICW